MARHIVCSWTKETIHDHFFREAKRLGYVSRAAFKLKEVQKKHKIIKPGAKVLDLGCSPGAWMQVACQELGPREKGGLVLGLDIQPTQLPGKYCDDRVKVLLADARLVRPGTFLEYTQDGFDTILSDMLQFTSGVNDVELALELAGTALNIATGHYYDLYGPGYEAQVGYKHDGFLKKGGNLVMKIYEGSGTTEFIREMQRHFSKVARMRVEASRSMSREFYAVGLGRK